MSTISRQFIHAVAFSAMALAAGQSLVADVVTQRSTNKQHFGEVSAINKNEITVKPKSGDAVKVPANDILKIKWDREPAKLDIARGDDERKKYEKALDIYTEVQTGATGNLKTALEFLIARATARLALEDASKVDDAIKKLEAYLKARPDHFGFYEATDYLGRVYAAKGDYAKARTAFEGLGKAPWGDFQMAAKIAAARMQLKQDDIAGAVKSFDEVAATNAATDAEKARRAEAQVGKAACLVKQKMYDDAMKLIDEAIKVTPAVEDQIMAEAYNLQGDCFQAQNKLKEAAIAYLHVPILYSEQKSAHAEALYHLAKISAAIGQPDRANEARDDLLSSFPNSEWAKKLQAGSN